MNKLKLKVCGMRDTENIQGLVSIGLDFMGFIFYSKSSRFADSLDEKLMKSIPEHIQKVGVFVNESIEDICEIVTKYNLDYVQLHGDEDLDFASTLKQIGIKIIKVFRVKDELPVQLREYEGIADYLLFDTSTSLYGGSGKQFDWNILKNIDSTTPILLSGGIQIDDIEKIKLLNISSLAGIDVNSKFEIEPGLKDLGLVKQLKERL